MIITLHTLFALVALALGPMIFFRTKGDRRHRVLGRAFLLTMAGVDLTAFGIYEFTGEPSLFHGLALLNALFLWRGYRAARRGAIGEHLSEMAYGYAALFAALGSRLPELLPDWPFALALSLGIAAPLLLTAAILRRVTRLRRPGLDQSSASSS